MWWAWPLKKKSSHLTERVSHPNRSPRRDFRALDLLLERAGERAWGRLKVACHPDWCSHDGHPSCERARREKGPLPSRARHQTPTCAALVVASDAPRPDAALAGEAFDLLFRGVRVDIAQGHRGDTHGHREALLSRTPVLFCSSDALRAHGQTLICTLRRLQDRRRPWRRSWAAGHASLMPPSR